MFLRPEGIHILVWTPVYHRPLNFSQDNRPLNFTQCYSLQLPAWREIASLPDEDCLHSSYLFPKWIFTQFFGSCQLLLVLELSHTWDLETVLQDTALTELTQHKGNCLRQKASDRKVLCSVVPTLTHLSLCWPLRSWCTIIHSMMAVVKYIEITLPTVLRKSNFFSRSNSLPQSLLVDISPCCE